MLLLQKRWEDSDGKVHALRVGTAVRRIGRSTDWMRSLRVPVLYGDASKQPGYGAGMELLRGERALYTVNRLGKRTAILE
jgi:hypothetical protein